MSTITQNKPKNVFILLSFFFILNANAQYVSTFAGSTYGFADGTGTAAQFKFPKGVAIDVAGTVYVADDSNNRIRKITAAGVVSTLAGSSQGFADGTGTAAQFNSPYGVAVDAAGNVYVADQNNHRIRKITAAGVVSTLAGSSQGFADGTGITANFNWPLGVATDGSGNVFVADSHNHSIRKITAAGDVTTLAGSGFAGFANGTGAAALFNLPVGLAIDASGNVFVADQGNNRIRKITAAGVVSTLAGSIYGYADGTGAAAQFSYPNGVAVDAAGNVFVADLYNNLIRKITPSGVVSTVAGSTQGYADGTGTAAQFFSPGYLAIDAAGIVFIGDTGNNRIRKITSPLGIANYHQNQVSVYPNPASSIINIDIENITVVKVVIFDMNGRALQTENITNNKTAINISNLANGVYLMQISTDKGIVSKKIVKN